MENNSFFEIYSPVSVSAQHNGPQNYCQFRTCHVISAYLGQNTHDRKSILSLYPLLESTGVLEGCLQRPTTLLSFQGIFCAAKDRSTVDTDLGTDATTRT